MLFPAFQSGEAAEMRAISVSPGPDTPRRAAGA